VSASRKWSGRWGQDHEQCDSDVYRGVGHGERACDSRKRRSREAHVGWQSAGTIKLNFINWILRSISVWRFEREGRCNKPARMIFWTTRAASSKNLREESVANRSGNSPLGWISAAPAASRAYQTGHDIALSAASSWSATAPSVASACRTSLNQNSAMVTQ